MTVTGQYPEFLVNEEAELAYVRADLADNADVALKRVAQETGADFPEPPDVRELVYMRPHACRADCHQPCVMRQSDWHHETTDDRYVRYWKLGWL